MELKEKNQNCHESDTEARKTGLKHGLMMILCCLLPILIISALPLLGLAGGRLSSFAFLLCPLMHIGMMFMMRKSGHGGCHGNKGENDKARG
ncbi:MAG: DUF2933 domain-containing protein [Thermotaleaceae bacterium]